MSYISVLRKQGPLIPTTAIVGACRISTWSDPRLPRNSKFRSRFSLEDRGCTSTVCELQWGWVTVTFKPTAAHYCNTVIRGGRMSPDRVGVSVISAGGEVKTNYLVYRLAR